MRNLGGSDGHKFYSTLYTTDYRYLIATPCVERSVQDINVDFIRSRSQYSNHYRLLYKCFSDPVTSSLMWQTETGQVVMPRCSHWSCTAHHEPLTAPPLVGLIDGMSWCWLWYPTSPWTEIRGATPPTFQNTNTVTWYNIHQSSAASQRVVMKYLYHYHYYQILLSFLLFIIILFVFWTIVLCYVPLCTMSCKECNKRQSDVRLAQSAPN